MALVNLDYMKELSAPALWNNKIHFLDNVAHVPQMEDSESFNSIVSNFYKSLMV